MINVNTIKVLLLFLNRAKPKWFNFGQVFHLGTRLDSFQRGCYLSLLLSTCAVRFYDNPQTAKEQTSSCLSNWLEFCLEDHCWWEPGLQLHLSTFLQFTVEWSTVSKPNGSPNHFHVSPSTPWNWKSMTILTHSTHHRHQVHWDITWLENILITPHFFVHTCNQEV